MRLRASFVVVLVLALAVAPAIGGDRRPAPRAFALFDYHIPHGDFEGSRLVPVAPTTGRRVGQGDLRLGDAVSGVVISPDRRFAAFGGLSFGEVVRVDLVHMRRLAPLHLVRGCCKGGGGESAEVLTWPRRRRLIATSGQSPGKFPRPRTLRVVDPVSGRVEVSAPLGIPVATDVGGDGEVVILAAPSTEVGPVRLVRVTPAGAVRSVVLPPIASGTSPGDVEEHREAALAVDFAARRAFVLAAGQPVAEVALASLAVRYHPLPEPGLDRGSAPAGPAQPTGTQNPQQGPVRLARWLGDGRIAVSGYDAAVSGLKEARTPLGLRVIDTRAWTVRTIDPAVQSFDVARGVLLAASVAWRPSTRAFAGFTLEGYSPGGRRRFRLLPYRSSVPATVGPCLVKEQRLYVQRSLRHYELRDPRSGKLLRRFLTSTDLFTLFSWRPPS